MTPDVLQRIFAEAGPDFTAEICTLARLNDLDPAAVEVLRRPFRCEPDFGVTSVNYDFAELPARAQEPS